VIADNASASRVVIGRRRARVSEVDLRLTGVVLEKNGEVVATGAAAAVLGNPLESIALLVQLLARDSSGLERGQLVLAGAITEAIPVQRGDVVSAAFDRLGAVTVSFC
jgi:2-keto-4-pentenoate hydratase